MVKEVLKTKGLKEVERYYIGLTSVAQLRLFKIDSQGDKMKPIVSKEKLSSLPERGFIRFKRVENADGTFTDTPYFPQIMSVKFDEKMIIAFVENGRAMMVGYDEEGAYKYEA